MKRLVIIDDPIVIREMLVQNPRPDANYKRFGGVGGGRVTVESCLDMNPDVSVVDANLLGPKCVDILRRGSKQFSDVGELVFSGSENPVLVRKMLETAAHSLLEKNASLCEFKKGLEKVANRGTYSGSAVASRPRNVVANPATSRAPISSSTESAKLSRAVERHHTKKIAPKLGMKVKTLGSHRTNLMRQLNLHDEVSLVRCSLEVGPIEPKKAV